MLSKSVDTVGEQRGTSLPVRQTRNQQRNQRETREKRERMKINVASRVTDSPLLLLYHRSHPVFSPFAACSLSQMPLTQPVCLCPTRWARAGLYTPAKADCKIVGGLKFTGRM